MTKRAIGILGGVGPEAGVCLEHYILEETRKQMAPQSDQEHIQTFHLSCPDMISDRTGFLKHENSDNPADGAYKVLELFEVMAEHQHEDLWVGIPCNTFHAAEIFEQLQSLMQAHPFDHVKIIHMIAETAKSIQHHYKHMHNIGLLSTTGTREARIYHDILEPLGFEIVEVPIEKQAQVHDTIYNTQWGIKSGHHNKAITRERMLGFANDLISDGAQAIILGCTEIPLVLTEPQIQNVPLIDPMRILAEQLVKATRS